jgi:hypothetical protein
LVTLEVSFMISLAVNYDCNHVYSTSHWPQCYGHK